jgi:hypothetical protein
MHGARGKGPGSRLAVALLVAGLVLGPAKLQAQVVAPPDVIRLKSGGMVRGTVVRAVPGSPYKIQLADGTFMEIAEADVASVGPGEAKAKPAAAAPLGAGPPTPAAGADAPVLGGLIESTPQAPPLPPPPPHAGEPVAVGIGGATAYVPQVRLRLSAFDPGATFSLLTDTTDFRAAGLAVGRGGPVPVAMGGTAENFQRLCTAPCEVSLPRGVHKLALTLPDGRMARTESLILERDSGVEARYVSKAGVRTAGWIILLGGTLLGTLMIFHNEEDCDGFDICELEFPLLVPGTILATASIVTGMVMALQFDRVDAQVR